MKVQQEIAIEIYHMEKWMKTKLDNRHNSGTELENKIALILKKR